MPDSRQTSVIDSPSSNSSSNFATNRKRSSIAEHSFHGIDTSRSKAESVTYVSGTLCYLCLGPLTRKALKALIFASLPYRLPILPPISGRLCRCDKVLARSDDRRLLKAYSGFFAASGGHQRRRRKCIAIQRHLRRILDLASRNPRPPK